MTLAELVEFVAELHSGTREKIWLALQIDLDTMPDDHPTKQIAKDLEAVLWWDVIRHTYA